jgi:hypothetical protein
MAIESTGWQPAWRPFRGPVALTLLVLALTAACSESSSRPGARPTTTTTRSAEPPAGGISPGTTPGTRTRPKFPPRRPVERIPPKRPVKRIPPNIDPTGKKEVTRELQSLFARVPNGTVVKFPKNARYRVERTLTLRNQRGLTFEGNGSTIFATKRGAFERSQIYVKRGFDIVFRDLTVRGVHPNGGTGEGAYVERLETQHGFKFLSTAGAELDHVTVTDVYGDFVYLGRDSRLKKPCRNIWIHDSTFARNGRVGIGITDAYNVIIERNRLDDTRRSVIDLEPNSQTWKISKVFILNNTIGDGRLLFLASHGQGPVDDVVISGNVLPHHSLTIDVLPPEGYRRSNWIVTNNVSDTTVNSRPMRFFSIDGLVVMNNTQRVRGGDPGLVLTDACGTRVSGNDFGRGGVARHGTRCAAPLRMPRVPSIAGRGGPRRPPTSTTLPRARPTTPAPPARPSPTRPAPGPGGESTTGWLVLAAVLVVILTAAIAWLVRRRRGT